LPRPSTAPAQTQPTTLPSGSKIIAGDSQLTAALNLLKQPEEMAELLRATKKARQALKAATTRAAAVAATQAAQ
jgi:hypothetical protein